MNAWLGPGGRGWLRVLRWDPACTGPTRLCLAVVQGRLCGSLAAHAPHGWKREVALCRYHRARLWEITDG